jgi:ATP-binding cassette, subfamily G (WHITE), member 2, SNQ2
MAATTSGAFAASVDSASGHQIVQTLSRSSQVEAHDSSLQGETPVDSSRKSSEDGGWEMKDELNQIKRMMSADHRPTGKLGVTWQNLNVSSPSADSELHENIISQFNIPQKIKEARQPPPLKKIIDSSHGCVRPGEMLLVLGRPGSGCTTLLKMLANHRADYKEVTGDVRYGIMTAKEAKAYPGQIVMNTEEV